MTLVRKTVNAGTLWWTGATFSGSDGSYREVDGVLVLIVGEPFLSFGAQWADALVCQPGLEEAGDVDVLIDAFETSMKSAVSVDVDQRLTLCVDQLAEFVGALTADALEVVSEGMRGGAPDRRGAAFEGPDDPRLDLRPDEELLAVLRTPFLQASDVAAEAEPKEDWQAIQWSADLSASARRLVDRLTGHSAATGAPGARRPSLVHALRESMRERSASLAMALAEATRNVGGLAFSRAAVRSGGSDQLEIQLRLANQPSGARALAFIEDDRIIVEFDAFPDAWEDCDIDVVLPDAIDEPITWTGDPGVAAATIRDGHARVEFGHVHTGASDLTALVAQVLVLPASATGDA